MLFVHINAKNEIEEAETRRKAATTRPRREEGKNLSISEPVELEK